MDEHQDDRLDVINTLRQALDDAVFGLDRAATFLRADVTLARDFTELADRARAALAEAESYQRDRS